MDKNISFEKSLEELENIVKKLELGECTLEESIELYKKGATLSAECNKMLEKAKLTIKTITDIEENND